MAFKLACVLLLAVATIAAADKPCCYPDQFETELGSMAGLNRQGKGSSDTENAHVAFDYTNKQVAEVITVYEPDFSTKTFQTIKKYAEHAQYIFSAKEQRCQKMDLPGDMEHCVNENATFAQTMYIGAKRELVVENFYYEVKEKGVYGFVSQTVTKEGCTPSSVTFQGVAYGTSMFSMAGFYNYVEGIKDPSIFTVPDYCPKDFSTEPPMYKPTLYKKM